MTGFSGASAAGLLALATLLSGCGSTTDDPREGDPAPTATVIGSPTPPPAQGARGWDERFVYIGVTTEKDVQAAASSIGARGLDAGDQEGQALAVAADLNRRGGVLGRQVKVVFRDLRTIDAARDPERAGNETCTYFTQDRPVVAVINPVPFIDKPSFRACLARSKVLLLSASVAAVDRQVGVELAPYYYQLVAPTWDALAPVLVSRLAAQGWFGGWDTETGRTSSAPAKVGVLVPDDPISHRVSDVITRALAAAGQRDVRTFAYLKGSEMAPAVLRFAGDGVTHVIAANADLFSFQLAADSQRYRPRYGITSANAPQTFVETNSPAGQNVGAMGVGWAPPIDVGDARDPGDVGPDEVQCRKSLAAGGQTFAGRRLAEAVAFAICDGLRLVTLGATSAGGLTGPEIARGLLQVAPSFHSALAFRSGLGADRLFVPGGVRDLAWDQQCRCMTYAGGTTYPI